MMNKNIQLLKIILILANIKSIYLKIKITKKEYKIQYLIAKDFQIAQKRDNNIYIVLNKTFKSKIIKTISRVVLLSIIKFLQKIILTQNIEY